MRKGQKRRRDRVIRSGGERTASGVTEEREKRGRERKGQNFDKNMKAAE